MAGNIYSDTFEVLKLDYDHVADKYEKKFDKVSRIDAKSETYETELTLDVNTEIYPIVTGEKIEVVLADSLREGDVDDGTGYDPTKPLGERADAFEYVMFGKIFKYAEEKSRVVIYMSFGGLLMALKGETKVLLPHLFQVDSKVYLFVRKI